MISVDMSPIHQLSSITDNPFDTETLTENPVVTELNVIGQEESRAVIRGTHTHYQLVDRSEERLPADNPIISW